MKRVPTPLELAGLVAMAILGLYLLYEGITEQSTSALIGGAACFALGAASHAPCGQEFDFEPPNVPTCVGQGYLQGFQFSMTRDRRYATRYSFEAIAEIFELLTGVCWNARTSDLSVVGCYLETFNPLPIGTEVQLELTYHEETFSTLGIVAHSKSSQGMGILFKATSSEQEEVLQKWLDQLSGDRMNPKVHRSAPQ